MIIREQKIGCVHWLELQRRKDNTDKWVRYMFLRNIENKIEARVTMEREVEVHV